MKTIDALRVSGTLKNLSYSVYVLYCKIATDELRFLTVLVKILVKSSSIKVSECNL